MSFLIAEGESLLAQQAAEEQREQLEVDALTQQAQALPAILRAIEALSRRIDELTVLVSAPRIRYPVRGPDGAITSVVDELVRE